ncbi:unnamed protein product (macronuclear) [Paramecium tetraurelia]|uniref:Nucleoporin Nup54 alpha-helical domain-containing protein n=1 Tax=Paramecium tetraurelia TaxID=5888 RepID=A0CQH0_PARTE|nr:uncharacterized protein GSPATT00009385001 [Paramecium tetraurelia]CAK73037.1 unnamed protein product [Paramecium tetraurelia]|eukprot:XP_001440434.1 hypothetical protein (macronuclear) [Paramecium tetraurelia strain d4-2]
MQQPQNSFSEYSEVQSYKFLFLRDVKITLEVAAETEIILEHFQNDKTLQQLALNKLINQINNSNKIHLELQSEYQQKADNFKLKVLTLRKEIRELFDILMDQLDNDQVRSLLYKYTDHNLEDTVNPFWQLITQVKLNEIPEQQMNLLKAINKKGETLRTLSAQIYTEEQIKKCIDEKKAFIKQQIQAQIK